MPAPNGSYCLYYPSNTFKQGRSILETFSKNYLTSYQLCRCVKFPILFTMFSSFHLNILLGMKTKRANINRKIWKHGNITWGIFGHLTRLGQSRTRKIIWWTISSDIGNRASAGKIPKKQDGLQLYRLACGHGVSCPSAQKPRNFEGLTLLCGIIKLKTMLLPKCFKRKF